MIEVLETIFSIFGFIALFMGLSAYYLYKD